MAQATNLPNQSSSKLNRRAALAGLACLPATALPALAHPDAELLDAARIVDEMMQLNADPDADPAVFERYGEAYSRAKSLRATTLEGLKAKARVAKTCEFDDDEFMASIGHDLLALTA